MILQDTIEKKATRDGFGDALLELGQKNEQVVALCADLTGSVKMNKFRDEFPDRFFQCGVAEANMIGVAAGLSVSGKIPFTGTFANFATGRVFDQIRQSVCYSKKNVKICASHAGLTLGEDGATHQILEDIGLMRMLPGMTVINPCDYNQTRLATLAIAGWDGPVYLRFGRPKMPNFTSLESNFEIGKGIVLKEGSDITLVATGHLVYEALLAAEKLENQGISAELINIHTIKPLDDELLLSSASKTGKIVVAEEHQKAGGLGDAVSHLMASKNPVPMGFVGMNNHFGESGKPEELLKKYGMDSDTIYREAMQLLK